MRLEFGNETRGYLDYYDVLVPGRGFQWTRNKGKGLRPGKQVTDDTIVAFGKAIVAGDTVIEACKRLAISSKTGYRWKKRLKLMSNK